MIASDTSAWIEYFAGERSRTAQLLEGSLRDGNQVMLPPVLFELLSGPGISASVAELIRQLPRLGLTPGFWERAAEIRRVLLDAKLKARAMDCLVAQVCIDHNVPLMVADKDFRHFVRFGLQIV